MNAVREVGLSSIVVQNREPLSADLDGGVLLMSAEKGRFFGLDAVGGEVWRRLEVPARVSDLCAGLAADYDGPPDAITQDVLALLGRMAERELIEILA
ncbi:hypothetical protein ABIE65_001144 [Constrictibacter sp. MBR-5]|jgi:hypothetical protein|uniref:PqqD family protein n=1 Tax=Constrictibacter sp. MBR-5 TaxID=3156467 RepID=UPI0033980F96